MSNIIFMARLTDEGDFVAARRAETLLTKHGFSVGESQRGSSRGILFGNYDIQKWRNLNEDHRAALHGILDGDRSSHAVIEIWDPAPVEAVAALADSLEGQLHTVITKRPPSLPSQDIINTHDDENDPAVFADTLSGWERIGCISGEDSLTLYFKSRTKGLCLINLSAQQATFVSELLSMSAKNVAIAGGQSHAQ